MEDGGPDAVFAYIDTYPDEQDKMDLFAMAARKFYGQDWPGKSIDRYAKFADKVIHRYLSKAEAAPNQEAADKFTQFANVNSYNLSANLAECWPGETPGYESRHFQAGLAAARRCVALRTKLNKGDTALCHAYWMAGAHLLALRQYRAAEESFITAYHYAHGTDPVACTDESSLDEIMMAGFIAVARWAAGDGGAGRLYDQACQAFAATVARDEAKKEDATFYLDQLKHVKRLYVG
ncbi:MAG: hypothetical protein K0R39_2190 [Symbiobacteriaceae bacterium]|nr:hypothetical protein [Symbiobacteriaceae bacterium]